MRAGEISGNTYVGVIDSNISEAYGGGVFVNGGGSFVMEGGTIKDNKLQATYGRGYAYGSGVHVTGANSSFTLKDGLITNNTAAGSGSEVALGAGGGVFFAASGGTFTMEGGTISNNTAEGSGSWGVGMGGGVSVYGGSFVLKDGTISGNIAKGGASASSSSAGGGVAIYSTAASFVMEGGIISGNTVPSGRDKFGGGVYVNAGSLTKSGGTIYGNEGALDADLKNTAVQGHAVYSVTGTRYRDTTAGPGQAMDSATAGVPGGWESP
jgi:hypothetical protein